MGSLKLPLNVDFLFNCIVVRECGLYILISYNLLRCPRQPNTWSIKKNISHVLERNVYFIGGIQLYKFYLKLLYIFWFLSIEYNLKLMIYVFHGSLLLLCHVYPHFYSCFLLSVLSCLILILIQQFCLIFIWCIFYHFFNSWHEEVMTLVPGHAANMQNTKI